MCASLEVEAALPSRHGLKVCAVIPHFRGLISTSDGSVLGFRGRRLLKFTPPFSTPTLVGLLPQSLLQIASTWRLAERFLRQNVNRMVQTRSGAFLCASPLGILRKAATETRFEVVFRAFQGRRPISLCIDGEDRIYFGEYFKNPKRKSVFVYMSDNDGVSWTRCHEFAAGSIRHIHGLQYDPFHDHIWVLTGDDGDEAQIGVASPGFGQYAVFLQSGQMSRAYSGLCTEHGFIFGSDAPAEQNKIFVADFDTKQVKSVQDVQHSVFYSGLGCGGYFLSTVVEPSKTNLTDHAHVWFSLCATQWEEVIRFRRDAQSSYWLQYPSAFIAQGPIDSPYCFLSLTATKEHDGGCVVLSTE